MPAQKQNVDLFARLNTPEFIAAHEEAKGQETEHDQGGRLPAGIDNGVAQLKGVKIGEYQDGAHKGKLFFRAFGVCVSPVIFVDKKGNKIPTAGGQTSIMEALCPTPERTGDRSRKTVKEHVGWMYNVLRLLGINTVGLKHSDLKGVFAHLEKTKPYFKFRTWRGSGQTVDKGPDGKWYSYRLDDNGKKSATPLKGPFATEALAKKMCPYADRDSQVQHVWDEVIKGYVPGAETNGEAHTEDSSADDNAPAEDAEVAVEEGTVEEQPEAAEEVSAEAEAPEQFSEFGDIDSLVALCNEAKPNGDSTAAAIKAQADLKKLAIAAGAEEDAVENADSWEEVGAMCGTTTEEEPEAVEAEPEPEPEPWKPTVGGTAKYQVIKGGKKVGKPIDVEIKTIDKKSKSCTIIDLATKTTYKGVLLRSLIAE